MSDYVNTIFAIAKIKNQSFTKHSDYENNIFKCNNINTEDINDLDIPYENDFDDNELEIRSDSKKDMNGKRINTFYLFKELYDFPKSSTNFLELENEFKQYEEYIDMNTFEVKVINWYNGADMPLFDN